MAVEAEVVVRDGGREVDRFTVEVPNVSFRTYANNVTGEWETESGSHLLEDCSVELALEDVGAFVAVAVAKRVGVVGLA